MVTNVPFGHQSETLVGRSSMKAFVCVGFMIVIAAFPGHFAALLPADTPGWALFAAPLVAVAVLAGLAVHCKTRQEQTGS